MQALSSAAVGENYTIKWMFGFPEVLDFMRERGMKEGSRVRVIQKFAGSVIISNGRSRIAVGAEAADRIQV